MFFNIVEITALFALFYKLSPDLFSGTASVDASLLTYAGGSLHILLGIGPVELTPISSAGKISYIIQAVIGFQMTVISLSVVISLLTNFSSEDMGESSD